MGAGASVESLSAEEIGKGVASLGKAYEAYNQTVVDEGISGEVLFKSVHEDENLFRAFVAENLGVQKPLHQTAMYTRYVKLLVDGEVCDKNAGPKMPIFDVRDAVERSPKDILNALFQIQGIPLDPDNVAAAVDKIAAAIIASVGDDTGCDGKALFHAFISYRVAADKDVAEKVYDKLSMKGLFPFLDKYKLLDGQPWKAGFLQGLKGSRCFISLISRKALESCRDHTRNHTHDNVLLEIETALRYKRETGNNAYIIPVMVGEYMILEGSRVLRKFEGSDFAGSSYADTVEGNGKAPTPVATIDPAAAAINAATAEVAAMKAKAEREIAEMKAKAEKEQIQQAPAKATVRIIGATGNNAAVVNGMYEATTEMSGNMPVYAKVGDGDMCLEYRDVKNKWQVKTTADKGKDGIYTAACPVSARCLPQDCPTGLWTVSPGYVPQPAVTISSVATQQEVHAYLAEVRKEAARVLKGRHNVLINGATGDYGIAVNGVYKPTKEMSDNVTVYIKVGDDDDNNDDDDNDIYVWLEYRASSKKWQVKRTKDKGTGGCWANCVVPVKCLPEDCPKGQWQIGDGGKLLPQPAVTISVVSQQEADAYFAEVKKEAARVVRGSHNLRITGATGDYAGVINGIYKPTEEMCGNVTVYVKVDDDDMWLYYNAYSKKWVVTDTAGKGEGDNGWAYCVVPAKCLPQDCPTGHWQVTDDKWGPQPSVTISVA